MANETMDSVNARANQADGVDDERATTAGARSAGAAADESGTDGTYGSTAGDGSDGAVELELTDADIRRVLEDLESTRQQALRIQADFDNFRRRTRQEKDDLQKYATKKVLADLLPVLDNLDRAMAAQLGSENSEFVTGIEMVRRQFLTVLEQHGVTPMETDGVPFNPNEHEAVMQEPADGRSVGIVCGELQKGYWLADKVLRPAMVKVTV